MGVVILAVNRDRRSWTIRHYWVYTGKISGNGSHTNPLCSISEGGRTMTWGRTSVWRNMPRIFEVSDLANFNGFSFLQWERRLTLGSEFSSTISRVARCCFCFFPKLETRVSVIVVKLGAVLVPRSWRSVRGRKPALFELDLTSVRIEDMFEALRRSSLVLGASDLTARLGRWVSEVIADAAGGVTLSSTYFSDLIQTMLERLWAIVCFPSGKGEFS